MNWGRLSGGNDTELMRTSAPGLLAAAASTIYGHAAWALQGEELSWFTDAIPRRLAGRH
jgi:hypothetical protein